MNCSFGLGCPHYHYPVLLVTATSWKSFASFENCSLIWGRVPLPFLCATSLVLLLSVIPCSFSLPFLERFSVSEHLLPRWMLQILIPHQLNLSLVFHSGPFCQFSELYIISWKSTKEWMPLFFYLPLPKALGIPMPRDPSRQVAKYC